MSQYTVEVQRILADFVAALESHPQASKKFVAQIRLMIQQGTLTQSAAIQEAITILEETPPNEP
jgi:hypothetical protein